MYKKTILGLLVFVVLFSLTFTSTHAQVSYQPFVTTLQFEVRNYEVNMLQSVLSQFSDVYPEGLITGYFGPLTNNAVIRLIKYSIEAVGIDDLANGARLNSLITTEPIGPTGPAGATGAIGAIGLSGTIGYIGSQGEIGLTGITGPVGSQGEIGLTGITGPISVTGPIGLTGPVGLTGLIGPAGTTGKIGLTGITGPVGSQGEIGLTGITGPVGSQGKIGLTGITGPVGSTGATGVTGVTGPIGPNFLVATVVDGNINKNKTFVIVSGGTLTAGHAYCAMVTAPGAGKVDNFIISVGGTTIGTCAVSGTVAFGSTTLTPTSISPGTVVQIDTNSTGSKRPGSIVIGQ